MRRVLFSLLAVAAVLAGQAPSGETPTFQTGTRLVQVNVIATDKNGPVADLTKEDFTILENGKEQEIAFFIVNSRDGDAESVSLEAPGFEFSNRPTGAGDPGGPLLIVFDMLNSYFADQVRGREAILEILRGLRPDDRVGLYILRFSTTVLQDFTSDSRRLIGALEQYGEWPDLTTFLTDGASTDSAFGGASGSMAMRRIAAEKTWLAVQEISNHLAKLPGRKSVVWVSADPPRFAFLAVDELVVYPVHIRGLVAFPAMRAENRTPPLGLRRPVSASLTQSMRRLADDTGGLALYNNNDLKGAIGRAITDADHTYTIGYYARAGERPEELLGLRSIRVRVNRRGVDLRYLKAYNYASYYDRMPPESTMEFAAESGLDSRRIGIDANVRSTGESLAVDAFVAADELSLIRDGERWHGALDILAVQRSATGAELSRTRRQVALEMNPASHQALLAGNLPIAITIEPFRLRERDPAADESTLPVRITLNRDADLAEVKLIVLDRTTSQVGSLTIPIEQ